MKKVIYTKPCLKFIVINIEESISTSSAASFNIGNSANDVLIDDWTEESSKKDIYFN